MKILDFYRAVLSFMGLKTNESGQVLNSLLGRMEPVIVADKPLFLPTPELLRESQSADRVYFHPLEERARPDSPVLTDLVYALNIRVNYITYTIAQSLMLLAENRVARATLSPDAYPMLEVLKDVDEAMIANFNKLMLARLKSDADRAVLRVFLKRGRSIKGEKFDRGTNVVFHLLADLDNGKYSNIKLREKDVATYSALIKFIFPGAQGGDDETYSRGSNSITAPFLEALLDTGYVLADKLNMLVEEYKDHINADAGDLFIDTSYMSYLGDITEMYKEARSYIPPQRVVANSTDYKPTMVAPVQLPESLNPPRSRVEAPVTPPPLPANNYPPAPLQPAQHPPQQYNGYAPPPPQGYGGYNGYAPPPQQYNGYAPPPPQGYGGYNGYAPPPPAPGYNGYNGYPVPEPVITQNGLDYSSITGRNAIRPRDDYHRDNRDIGFRDSRPSWVDSTISRTDSRDRDNYQRRYRGGF